MRSNCDLICRDGQGRMTGHQKSTLVNRKHACSTLCQASDCNANSYAAGTCQPTYATFIASQAKTFRCGCRSNAWTTRERNNGCSIRIVNRGMPRSSGTTGAPSTRSGGATDINTKCCAICMNRSDSLNVSRGDDMATKTETMPDRNAAKRQGGSSAGRVLWARIQPIVYMAPTSASSTVGDMGISHLVNSSESIG